MHYNLLFNGCSFTQGSELEGKNKNFEYRDKHRYSHIISEKIGKTYDNIAIAGNSNDAIVRETIEWFERGNTCDLAIIQFTYIERFEYICRVQNIPLKVTVMLTNERIAYKLSKLNYEFFPAKTIKFYYKEVYNDNDAFYKYYKNLFLLEQYFEKKNIKYIFLKINNVKLNFDQTTTMWKNLCKNRYSDFTTLVGDILDTDFGNHEDYCKNISDEEHPFLTGSHPSILGHQKIADYLIERINNAHFV